MADGVERERHGPQIQLPIELVLCGDLRGMQKGYVRINGFHLDRYWNVGPQYTLYVPGELLKEENTIEIFEQYGADTPFILPTCTDSILE
ncbi:MAG: hypothetical protein IJ489_04140 [Clostridia bacterium]|nr:hypothetical protein [Clostridia bacterium]